MKPVHLSRWSLLVLLMMASTVSAHPGHGQDFFAGVMHPLSGPDHLLTLVLIGWWSASHLDGAWGRVPIGFVLALLGGALLGRAFPIVGFGLELFLASSVMILGAALWRTHRASIRFAAALVALIGMAHGFAHGLELPAVTTSWQWLPGLLSGSLIVIGVGVVIGHLSRHRAPSISRWSGLAALGAGATLAAIAGLS